MALVDGKVRLTCTLPVRSLQGKEVRTLDGLSEATRAALGQAFAQTGGTQCGYCTPGIAVQAAALFERSPLQSTRHLARWALHTSATASVSGTVMA